MMSVRGLPSERTSVSKPMVGSKRTKEAVLLIGGSV